VLIAISGPKAGGAQILPGALFLGISYIFLIGQQLGLDRSAIIQNDSTFVRKERLSSYWYS
jgi:hypothetical protein